MNQNYPEYIIRTIRQFNGLDEEDTSRDEEFQSISPEEAFDQVLEYEGIIGYRYTILRWIEDIFKVKLDSCGEEQTIEDFNRGLQNIFKAQNLSDDAIEQLADDICTTIELER